MGDVIEGDFITRLDVPAEKVLKAALDADLDSVFVAGFDKDGDLYIASSKSDGGDLLWLMERARHKLMLIADEAE